MPIKMKRSAVAGKVPTTAQLDLGELAVNTRDGKIYLKTDDGAGGVAVQEFRNWADVTTYLAAALAPKADAAHGHALGDVSGLQAALDGKAYAVHTHGIGDVADLWTVLNGKLTSAGGTLTGGTVAGGILSGDLKMASGSSTVSTTFAMDPANGLIQLIDLGASVAFTDSLADDESVLFLISDGSAWTITWPTITWLSGDGAAPGLQTAIRTVIAVFKIGGTLYGYASNGA